MTGTDTNEAAWAVLNEQWAWRIVLVLAVGEGARLWRLLVRRPANDPSYLRWKRHGALAALVLAIWSGRLLLDTYRLEAEQADALQTIPCSVSSSLQSEFFGWVACSEGGFYWRSGGEALESGQRVQLTVLPTIGRVVLR